MVYVTINGETIQTTPEHPFYVVVETPWLPLVESGRWVNAGELRVGDRVRNAEGASGVVSEVSVVVDAEVMYNLTVDQAHTFFVGDQQWLVHNTFDDVEQTIIQEANHFFAPGVMESINQAFQTGTYTELMVNGRPVVVDPSLPFSGFTMFDEGGFIIGREAFSSEEELQKTILHELHRLNTSEILNGSGVSQDVVSKETRNAQDFADRAYEQIRKCR